MTPLSSSTLDKLVYGSQPAADSLEQLFTGNGEQRRTPVNNKGPVKLPKISRSVMQNLQIETSNTTQHDMKQSME